ncbi:MAG: Rrf2 family transcriptional regulator [Alphaproteobacteria bacterium]|jgi:Rrf2 family protein|nr:Rrf2 family transcriptional regulator [Alphaproteobacteria bacterium]MCZ6509120.1 Rrf2 family transcriptional regulator [Alphaproteobacteria bacterium]MCZ6586323.1 Rrf2 family transcriptional regulator [Alphaproteobacteria bacterium]MCZ6589965.1 Rrf2 family transcriptional regulator [Alphaproteobacteria bacterium]MCZ6839306.1 Rrf2 family transcriptional regulator [Alphaproteobacteria bacterium]
MFRLSRKTLFAIEAVLDIAYNAGAVPVQSREITRRQGIPRRYLEQVLQNLVRAGVLSGVRGPRGGYRLARERRRITVGEVVRVILDMETRAEPIEEIDTSSLGATVVGPMWESISQQCMQHLDGITIQDLCNQAREAGVESEGAKRLDYTI